MSLSYVPALSERRWQQIDTSRWGHVHLRVEDRCFCLFSNDGTTPMAAMTFDLKGKSTPVRRLYAINHFAEALAHFIDTLDVKGVIYLAPMPPHTTRSNPRHDRRLELVCGTAAKRSSKQVRALHLLETVTDGTPTHWIKHDRRAEDLMAKTAVALNYWAGPDDLIVVVDDVITSGAHFRCAREYLEGVHDAPIIGAFLARTPTRYEKRCADEGRRARAWYVRPQPEKSEAQPGLLWMVGHALGKLLA